MIPRGRISDVFAMIVANNKKSRLETTKNAVVDMFAKR